MRAVWCIAKTVLLEAVRRRELYAIVLTATGIILAAGMTRTFSLGGLDKFYREISLQIMNLATAMAVIVLAARQLPREFENRTIYPLLAKPVGRAAFLMGKFTGVMAAGAFCYAMFLSLYMAGLLYLGAEMRWALLLQTVYLQLLALTIVAALAFVLSLLCNKDAAITITALLYAMGQTYTTALDYVYDYVSPTMQWALLALNFGVPQFTLYDMSAKLVHGQIWGPAPAWVIHTLTINAAMFLLLYLGGAYLLFRRRPL